jgi:FkbM family methyltransferase
MSGLIVAFPRLRRFIRGHPLVRTAMAGPRALRRAWFAWRYAPVRAAFARMTTLLSEDVICRVPEFDGTFQISPRSHLFQRIAEVGFYEPHIAAHFRANIVPSRDIIDVGANVGFFTVAGARNLTSGRILAAEPTGRAFRRLEANIARNGVGDRAIPFNGLVGAERGTGTIHSVADREEYSSVHEIEHFSVRDEPRTEETVPRETIDALVAMHGLDPALIKVDVEGGELEVFLGARQTLEHYRPVIISEIWPSKHGGEILRLLESCGYAVADAQDPTQAFQLDEVGDVICVPRDGPAINRARDDPPFEGGSKFAERKFWGGATAV